MRVNFIYHNFLKDDYSISIGGIQTYIQNLITVCTELGLETRVFQKSKKAFTTEYGNTTVVGISEFGNGKFVNRCIKNIPVGEIVIFASDELCLKRYDGFAIAIQHGITWDIPCHKDYSRGINRLYSLHRWAQAYKRIKGIGFADYVVGVDYNFPNWYKTQVAYPDVDIDVIPNFSRIPKFEKQINSNLRIIFARRLHWYRGTRIFVNAIKRMLVDHSNIEVIIAGEGPDESLMRSALEEFNQVSFIKYKSEDSLLIHNSVDIAVIPTVGSEGTSLSLLEAMASKCAVICTGVGGMTNIVIDHYNGLIVKPDEDSLYEAISELIEDRSLAEALVENGYNTVTRAFSFESWKSKWTKVLGIAINEVGNAK